ncbi:hypothetical protein F5884DRAFT_864955 [Xylogone sp. PMI_703]|nr:hypothetical protein F5884DRAFT_864955 [Xylogone sp. PMI_703]
MACPYNSDMVFCKDSDSNSYYIHKGVLSKYATLQSCIEDDVLELDIDSTIFDYLLTFLYTGKYDYDEGERASTSSYELGKLKELALGYVTGMVDVSYVDVLDVAIEVYNTLLPFDDQDYRNYFKNKTRDAAKENPNLFKEDWFLDAVRGGGRVAIDLFSALANPPRSEVQEPTLAPNSAISCQGPCEKRLEHMVSLGINGP